MATSALRPDDTALAAVLARFVGRISQTPPRFSAIKLGGRRAYALARDGRAVELAPRLVQIDRLELVSRPDADTAYLEVECGKGTYIRSLGRDIAVALGTVGHIAELRRTACGPFHEGDSVTLDALAAAAGRDDGSAQGHDLAGNSLSPGGELGHTSALFGYLRPVVTALDDIPALALTDREAQRLSQGMAVKLPEAGVRPAAPIGTMSPAEESAGPGTDADKGVVRA